MVFACVSQQVSGHAFGNSVETVVGEHIIDIGFDAPVLEPGLKTLFDFLLLKNALPYPAVPYKELTVTFYKGQKILHTQTFITGQEFEPVIIEHTFQKPGTYHLDVRFMLEDGEVLETKAPLKVIGTQWGVREILFMGAAILACWIPLYLFYDMFLTRRKRSA